MNRLELLTNIRTTLENMPLTTLVTCSWYQKEGHMCSIGALALWCGIADFEKFSLFEMADALGASPEDILEVCEANDSITDDSRRLISMLMWVDAELGS